MMTSPDLSIVVPAYNEEERIHLALDGIARYAPSAPERIEVVVVCDGCTDRTAEVARGLLAGAPVEGRVVEYRPNRGKGGALKVGMLEARGRYRLFTDADLATPIETIDTFRPHMRAGVGVILGTRKSEAARIERRQPWLRETLGKGFTAFSNLVLGTGVSDFTCGFKAFRADAAEAVFSRLTVEGWAYDAEIVYLARRLGFSAVEVPVRWADVEGTKVSMRREVLHCARDLVRIRWNALRGRYEGTVD